MGVVGVVPARRQTGEPCHALSEQVYVSLINAYPSSHTGSHVSPFAFPKHCAIVPFATLGGNDAHSGRSVDNTRLLTWDAFNFDAKMVARELLLLGMLVAMLLTVAMIVGVVEEVREKSEVLRMPMDSDVDKASDVKEVLKVPVSVVRLSAV